MYRLATKCTGEKTSRRKREPEFLRHIQVCTASRLQGGAFIYYPILSNPIFIAKMELPERY